MFRPGLSAGQCGAADSVSGAGGLLGWAGFSAWAGWLARGPFFFKLFSFSVFETKGLFLQQILQRFD
jgi:hypothetical protein